MLNNDSSTTPCPDCGKPMPMMTWIGKKPSCHRCNGATIADDGLRRIRESSEQTECLHEKLEDSLPENRKGGAHMLVCNCPKCRTYC